MENEGSKIWLVLIGVVFALVVGMWVFSPMEVTVVGTGKVSVPATSASFNVTVVASNESANEALSQVREKVDKIKGVLAEIGIGSSDISESQVTITPAAVVTEGAKGYQATSTMSVKTRNVAQVGEIVVNMYATGAVVVSQPVVSVEDATKLEQEALDEAMESARESLKNTVGLRPIRKMVAIEQASSGDSATATQAIDSNDKQFEIVKAVSVTYRVW